MKEIKLSQGKVALVDDADFEWLTQFKWYAHKYGNIFYAIRNSPINGKRTTIRMHRQILGITDPRVLGDHRDRNGLNNCRNNLRIATRSQNNVNRTSHKNSTSNYLGVGWHKRDRKWRARIAKEKKLIYLGYFNSETDAAIAYNNAAIEIYGEFANLNIITIS